MATVGPGRQILSKQLLTAISPSRGRGAGRLAEQLTLRLPSVTPAQGQDYSLFIGFQLDDEELKRREQPLLR